jgi:predicted PurR-regulated permease PerM
MSALLSLLVMLAVFLGIFFSLVPLIAEQASHLSAINVQTLLKSFNGPLNEINNFLLSYGLITKENSIEKTISAQLISVFNIPNFTYILDSIVGFTKSILVAIFVISFVTFFFLKDERMFYRTIMLMTPERYQTEITHILVKCKKLLTRYALGLLLDLTLVITLMSVGMKTIGLENAILIGFLSGIMNIIPYVGPIIGASLGIMLALSNNLNMDFYTQMIPMMEKMLVVYVIVNLLDAMFLQPTIYSNSVKAHPLEIFLVILIAGSITGIIGMIFAIPAYTVIRIIAKEFLSKSKFISKLTENI